MNSTKQVLILPEHEQLMKLETTGKEGLTGISYIEILHLAWLASQVPMGGSIVEIGSYKGRSTCVLGCGLKYADNPFATIHAVDLWLRGGTEHKRYHSEETWDAFCKQISEMGLKKVVKPVMMDSIQASKRRRRPIHLLFIDADHRYRHVSQDFMAWAGFIPSGGRIAFHDYGGKFTGVQRTVEKKVIPSKKYTDFQVHGRIWSATRV